jgi:gamma-butyrobetaine dioxygenase
MTTADPVRVIADLFAAEGAREYLGEPVTQAEHMLQAAALAEAAGAGQELTAAALLHDVGHFTGPVSGPELVYPGGRPPGAPRASSARREHGFAAPPLADEMDGRDNQHGEAGAAWLARWFGPGVTEPVRLHVAAKRYLCAVEPGYLAALSPASAYTLRIQGGPMSRAETAVFEGNPWCTAALRVRRWDDAAKDPAATVPAFGYYRPLLRQLARQRARELARGAGPGGRPPEPPAHSPARRGHASGAPRLAGE